MSNELILGSHVLTSNLGDVIKQNMKCIQLFLVSPRTFYKSKLSPITQGKLITIQNKGIICYIHTRYVINIARGKSYNKYNGMMDIITNDFKVATDAKAYGLVFHTGKYVDFDPNEALNNMLYNICVLIDNCIIKSKSVHKTKFIFETPAHVGSDLCYTIEQLSEFFKQIPNKYRKYFGFCIDTAHIWASGYNITTFEGVINYINTFNKLIEWKYVDLIHLNDSKYKCNSGKDGHADITHGKIWNKDTDGLELLLLICRLTGKHVVFETPSSKNGKYKDFNTVKQIMDNQTFDNNNKIINFIKLLKK
jgi:apurinic endonuclease APN1